MIAATTAATVDLRTLTVNGKRVTLTFFRQIREAELIADDGTLNGHPWGAVNYHPDKCGDSAHRHWHIVWQRGDELLRSRVNEQETFDWPTRFVKANPVFQSPETDRYLTSSVHEWAHGRLDEPPLREQTGMRARGYQRGQEFTEGTLRVRGDASDIALYTANRLCDVRNPSFYDAYGYRADPGKLAADFDQARTHLDEEVAAWELTRDQVVAAYRTTVAAEQDRRQRHRDLRAQLAELPQLFIAL